MSFECFIEDYKNPEIRDFQLVRVKDFHGIFGEDSFHPATLQCPGQFQGQRSSQISTLFLLYIKFLLYIGRIDRPKKWPTLFLRVVLLLPKIRHNITLAMVV